MQFLKILPLALLLLAPLAGLGLLYQFQHKLLFHPGPKQFGDCDIARDAGALPISVENENSRIRYFWIETRNARANIIYFHGNAGSACDRLPLAKDLAAMNLNVAVVEYPGFGGDALKPSEARILANAEAVYRYIAEKTQGTATLLFGESLGTGVATKIASEHEVAGLILQSPYPSIRKLAKMHYPYFPVDAVLIHNFEAESWAKLVTASTLILQGKNDTIIPPAFAREQSGNFVRLHAFEEFDGFGHNDLAFENEAFWLSIRNFIKVTLKNENTSEVEPVEDFREI